MAKKTSPINQTIKKPAEKSKSVKTQQSNGQREAKQNTTRRNVKRNAARLDVKRQLKIQKALYEIADAASAVRNMQSFYKKLHKIVGKLMYAENFFIALYDPQSDLISWPYHADVKDTDNVSWSPEPLSQFKGGTAYIIKNGKSFWMTRDYDRMLKSGEIELVGTKSVDSIGIPLKGGKQVLGAMVVQSYSLGQIYTEQDLQVLSFVAQHIATALTRAHAIEAERQRSAELAIINSVQEGLAKQLDFQSIVDLVGEKVGEIFKADTTAVGMIDVERDWGSNIYYVDRGVRIPFEDGPVQRPSLTAIAIDSRTPLLLGTKEEMIKLGAVQTPSPGDVVDRNESFLGLPILAGEKLIGVIAVQSYKQNAFKQDDLRLLQTITNSMSVALENARLFDETQRLLKETEQRNAELAIINSVQEGLASKLEMQAIYDLVGNKIRDIFQVEVVYIAIRNSKDVDLIDFPYYVDRGDILKATPLTLGEGLTSKVIMDRQPLLIGTFEEQIKLGAILEADERANTYLGIPIIVGDFVAGVVSVQSYEENAFNDSDIRLLTTLASSMGVALENARLFDETQHLLKETEERNAELAVINSVQAALAAKLDMQGIYDAVGDKIREIFDVESVLIFTIDRQANLFQVPYGMKEIRTYDLTKVKDKRFFTYFDETKQTLLINKSFTEEAAKYGIYDLGDPATLYEMAETGNLSTINYEGSALFVPLLVGSEVKGFFSLQDSKRENAFSESDVRLLETLANSMSIALENARLFDETQRLLKETEERNAELAIINSVQEGLASKLEMQAIYELVGGKICEIFNADSAYIGMYDRENQLVHAQYAVDRGYRLTFTEPFPMGKGYYTHVIQSRKPLLVGTNEEGSKLGGIPTPRPDTGKDLNESYLGVPLLVGDEVKGVVAVQSYRHNAYGGNDARLLTTLANSMSVALENARLFDETQRLLKETEQRAAELAIINSVQQGLASKLDFQGIIELVGDQIRGIFDAQVVTIPIYDLQTRTTYYPYAIEKGERVQVEPHQLSRLAEHLLSNRQPVLLNSDEDYQEYGIERIPGTEYTKSFLVVPLIVGDQVSGAISIQNLDRSDAFSDSDIRLLQTLASSLSVSLENARLFDETQRLLKETEQHNAELAIINSVQQGLATKLDMHAIYELVGDKISEITGSEIVVINTWNTEAGIIRFEYIREKGKRFDVIERPFTPLNKTILPDLESGKTIIWNEGMEARMKQFGHSLPAGEMPLTVVSVPLKTGDRINTSISLQDTQREHAFSDSTIRLIETLAGSAGIALENARLFNETQRLLKETEQRAAELAIINRVQQGLASKLDFHGIIDLVGDKIRDIFDAQAINITQYDAAKSLFSSLYTVERGIRHTFEPMKPGPIYRRIVDTRESLLFKTRAEYDAVGAITVPGTETSMSGIYVPLMQGKEFMGVIALENVDRENAFTESSMRLLTTLANSMSVALENARLFDETQRLLNETEARAAELAIINTVSNALAGELDLSALIELVGEQVRTTFKANIAYVALLDEKSETINFPYTFGEELTPLPYGEGLTSKIIETGRPLLINRDIDKRRTELGATLVGIQARSYLGVPIFLGGKAIGVVSVQSTVQEGVFTENDQRLLGTIAANVGVALQNARFFDEIQTRNREISEALEQQTATSDILSIIAENPTDVQPVLNAVAERAARLCNSYDVVIVRIDGDRYRVVAHWGPVPLPAENLTNGIPLNRDSVTGRAMLDRQTIHIHDLLAEAPEEYPLSREFYKISQQRTMLVTPLVRENEVIGSIMIRRQEVNPFNEKQIALLKTFADQAAIAIENVRLFTETQRLLQETEQRAAELQIINSVQEGLASKLDVQAIYDLVGDKIRDIFHAQGTAIYLFDHERECQDTPYCFLKKRFAIETHPYSEVSKLMIDTPQPRIYRTVNEYRALGGTILENQEEYKSGMYVPLMVGKDIKGMIGIANLDRENAYHESDLRLLQTLANSMSVALENARLFDETQRLLQETEQRAAELQIINSVQEGLASKIDMQAIYDLVGNKIREVFKAESTLVALYDRKNNEIQFPYVIDDSGKRFDQGPKPLSAGFSAHIIKTKVPLVINQDLAKRRAELGSQPFDPAHQPKAYLGVPMIVGQEVVGVVALSSPEENAFSESDVRLLQTLTSSMSVALENVRLFSEIESQRQYLEAIITNSPVAIITADLNGRVVSWNPAAETLFGYTGAEAVGRDANDLIALSDEIRAEALICSMQTRKGELFHSITRRNRKDRTLVDVDMAVVPVSVGKERMGIVGIYHDISELQRARQEAIAANEAKSSFLATMSHEIRTPMNAVIGMSGLLMDTELNKEQRDYAETIRNSGDALLAIINDILDFSKIEAGKMEVEVQPFDLRECVESALDLTASQAVEKGLDLAYLIDDDVPTGIRSDVTRLRQILINLLSNAIKFTEKGEVVLMVKRGKAKNELLFNVRDTGIGISEQHLSRLFQSFSQADSSTTRKFGGTGLGLAISKRLAEMMGGEMHAESKGIGKGSTFIFTIKAEPAKVAERKATQDLQSIQSVLQGKRVLIVDDNATNRRILMLQSEKWGMRPSETEHPHEALEWIDGGEHFDLAILDLQMPDMDGVMLTREIRKRYDENSLPVILLTSLGRREIGAEDLEFAAYLTKPLKPSHLYDALVVIFAPRSLRSHFGEANGVARNVISPKVDTATSSAQHRAVIDSELGKQHPLRILLAEDNAVNQKLALRILEQMGYRADVASNGIETVESIERQTYDVILMDVQMPEMDGLDATREIRKLANVTQPHIIAMTANALEGDREMCIAAGMNDYISKPIRVNELVDALLKAERK
jgi:PAS domain S-box-containing protein